MFEPTGPSTMLANVSIDARISAAMRLDPTGPGERCGKAESLARTAGNGTTEPTGPREPFDWLDDAQLRHGGLRMVQTAIARGWLEGPEHTARRARLVDALMGLIRDPASPIRDKLQACRLLAGSMTAANLRMLDRSSPRRRKARRRRMGTNLQGEGGPPCGPTGRSGRPDPTGRPDPPPGRDRNKT
jgi:hypothetical protein